MQDDRELLGPPIAEQRDWGPLQQLQSKGPHTCDAGSEDPRPAALRILYERYKDSLLTVARCLVMDASAAEDVLHDAFVGFAAQAGRLQLRGSLRNYLVTCVANRARDELRRRSRSRCTSGPEALNEAADPAGSPLEMAADCEEGERLQQALSELPYEQREVIVLHLHGDMTFKEVAGELGVSINTVQSRYRYGLEKLRCLLNGGDPTRGSRGTSRHLGAPGVST